jgi:hypothetical protein
MSFQWSFSLARDFRRCPQDEVHSVRYCYTDWKWADKGKRFGI